MTTNNINIAVLGSTKGTDLQYIIDQVEKGRLPGIQIKFVLSNRRNSGILEKAEKYNLNPIFLSGKDKTREEYDQEVSQLLEDNQVDLVLLIGYMKLMSSEFVQKWKNKVMNIHPSLLPAFEGQIDLNVHQAVLERGCKVTGATLILIDEGADTGPIVSQGVVFVKQDDTVESLKGRVQLMEGELLVVALQEWRDGKLIVQGTLVKRINKN